MRPVLRPGIRLHRDPTGRAALLDGGTIYWVDEVTAALLERLDGLVDEATLLRRAADDPDMRRAWARLLETAVVVDLEAAARLVRDEDERVRRDRLPDVTALVALDPSTAELCWHRRRTATVAVTGHGAVTADLARLLGRAGIGTVVSGGDRTRPDMTVLTDDHEPTTDVVEQLTRDGVVHLPAGLRGSEGVVGPCVRPGASPCLRCVDLARCADDPGWGSLRERLSDVDTMARTTAKPASTAVTTAVAALAAADVLAQVDGRDPSTLGATASLSLDNPLPVVRRWPVAPACGCAWDMHFPSRGQWAP